jgi:hypothetical protein
MSPSPNAPRNLWPVFAVLASLVCAGGACSLRSLDYLKNGHRQDGAARDSTGADAIAPSRPDAAIIDAIRLDALSKDSVRETDGGVNLDAGMANEVASGDEIDSGTACDLSLDGDDSVPASGIGDAGGDEAVEMDTSGWTGALDSAPEIDGAILGGQNPDGDNLDGLPDDGVLLDGQFAEHVPLDSSIPDVPVPDSAIPDSPPPRPSVLFVVGVIPLGANDAAMQTRLIGKGYDVTLVQDANLASVTSVTATVVLISRTVTAANVAPKFRDTARPVMVCKPPSFADMGFVDGSLLSEGSTLLNYSTLVVNSGAGELAAGLSGTITVLQPATNMNYGVPNSHAVTVASIPGLSSACSIFAYDSGAQMYNFVAPARRVGFSLGQNNATDLTANGWLLFDAALAWLAK